MSGLFKLIDKIPVLGVLNDDELDSSQMDDEKVDDNNEDIDTCDMENGPDDIEDKENGPDDPSEEQSNDNLNQLQLLQQQMASLSNLSNNSQGGMLSNFSTSSSTTDANLNESTFYPPQPQPQRNSGPTMGPTGEQQQQQTPSLSNLSNNSQGEITSNFSSFSSSTTNANSNQTAVYPPQPPPQQNTGQSMGQTGEQQQLSTQRQISPTQSQIGGDGDLTLTPQQDAVNLYSCFKGTGCDTGRVVHILAHRNATHRALIKEEYKSLYSEDLITRLSAELSGKFKGDINEKVGVNLSFNPTGVLGQKFSCSLKIAVSHWMLDEPERDATIAGNGLSLMSTDLQALTEVICSRTPSQILSLKRAYFDKYVTELAKDINAFTSPVMGYHKQLLVACLDKARNQSMVVDLKMAEDDAKLLYKDGEGRFGTNEGTFIRIFTQRNRTQLVEVNSAYHRLYGHSLEKAVEKETSGYFQYGLLTLLSCAENPAKYFAEVVYKAMKGMGTDDTTLTRVVVTRAESDMKEIKEEYAKLYKKSLKGSIQKNTSGHYRTFLLYLVDLCY